MRQIHQRTREQVVVAVGPETAYRGRVDELEKNGEQFARYPIQVEEFAHDEQHGQHRQHQQAERVAPQREFLRGRHQLGDDFAEHQAQKADDEQALHPPEIGDGFFVEMRRKVEQVVDLGEPNLHHQKIDRKPQHHRAACRPKGKIEQPVDEHRDETYTAQRRCKLGVFARVEEFVLA